MLPFWFVVLKLFEKKIFSQFYTDLSKKSKSIKAVYIYIYIYIWKVSLRTLRKRYYSLRYDFLFRGYSGLK